LIQTISLRTRNSESCIKKRGDLPRAEYHFRRTLEIFPGDYWSLLYLANLLAVQGKNGEAEETYRLATSLHPDSKDGAEFFANFLESIGKNGEAAAVRGREFREL
jgi:Tfp pilus assembly protein PilF